jgi:hypothetical protein
MTKKKEVVVPVKLEVPKQVFRQYLTKEELLGMIDRIHAKQKDKKEK